MNFLLEFNKFHLSEDRPKNTEDNKLDEMMYDLDHILREISDNQPFPFVVPFAVSTQKKNRIFAEIGPTPDGSLAPGTSFILNDQIIDTLERCVDYVEQTEYKIKIYFANFEGRSDPDISRNLEEFLGRKAKFIGISIEKRSN